MFDAFVRENHDRFAQLVSSRQHPRLLTAATSVTSFPNASSAQQTQQQLSTSPSKFSLLQDRKEGFSKVSSSSSSSLQTSSSADAASNAGEVVASILGQQGTATGFIFVHTCFCPKGKCAPFLQLSPLL